MKQILILLLINFVAFGAQQQKQVTQAAIETINDARVMSLRILLAKKAELKRYTKNCMMWGGILPKSILDDVTHIPELRDLILSYLKDETSQQISGHDNSVYQNSPVSVLYYVLPDYIAAYDFLIDTQSGLWTWNARSFLYVVHALSDRYLLRSGEKNAHNIKAHNIIEIFDQELHCDVFDVFHCDRKISLDSDERIDNLAVTRGKETALIAAVISHKKLAIYDAETCRCIAQQTMPNYTRGIAFSPDKKYVLCGQNGKICAYDPATLKEQMSFKAHCDYIFSLAYSPSGDYLASVSRDNSLKLWDGRTFRLLAAINDNGGSLNLDDNPFRSVAFSPDSKQLAAGKENGSVEIYEIKTEELKSEQLGTAGEIVPLEPVIDSVDKKETNLDCVIL